MNSFLEQQNNKSKDFITYKHTKRIPRCFVVSAWNTRGVFVGYAYKSYYRYRTQEIQIFLLQFSSEFSITNCFN